MGSGTRYTEIVELSQDACWRALQTRDARFDGRFVTAVSSTGIYCRPWRAYAAMALWMSQTR